MAPLTESCGRGAGRSRAGRLLHDDWQGGGQAPPLQPQLDEFHGDGELQPVHLAVAIRVSEAPTWGGGGEERETESEHFYTRVQQKSEHTLSGLIQQHTHSLHLTVQRLGGGGGAWKGSEF